MKKFISGIVFTLLLATGPWHELAAQSIPGRWEGTLSHGGGKLRIVFNINEQNGNLQATLDSPDQGARGLKVDSIRQKEDSLFLYLPQLGASFKGELQKEPEQLNGNWQQGGLKIPISMEKTTAEAFPARPQLPHEPYPYHSEEVTFKNKAAGVSLAGTFTRPKKEGQFPAVVLISGSGPQDRDETIMDHKPFLLLADYLTRQGFAVLRYDDRGFGRSTGNFTNATTADFASDAAAAVDFLQYRPDVHANQIGIIGHSEGGIIAPMVANSKKPVRFLVLLAAPVLSGYELLLLQNEKIRRTQGSAEEEIQSSLATQCKLLNIVKNEQDNEKAGEQLRAQLQAVYDSLPAEAGQAANSSPAVISGQVAQLLSPWFRYFISYKPAQSFAQLKVPTLAIYGTKDLQVPAKENAEALQNIIEEHNKNKIRIVKLEDLNHLFQPATTGLPDEYNRIETTIAPEVLVLISEWMKEQLPEKK